MSFELNPNLGKKIKKALQEGLEDASEVIQDKIKKNAPKKTGFLAKNINISNEDLKTRIGTDVEYAPYVEFGTRKMGAKPFFRPGIKESKDKALREFKDRL